MSLGTRRAGVLSVPALASSCLSTGCARSFLALLLFSASQDVVRDPPYGASGAAYRPAYRIRDSAYRSRRRCFVDKDFVLLYSRYRSAGGLRCPTTHPRHCSLGGPQGFFALPDVGLGCSRLARCAGRDGDWLPATGQNSRSAASATGTTAEVSIFSFDPGPSKIARAAGGYALPRLYDDPGASDRLRCWLPWTLSFWT